MKRIAPFVFIAFAAIGLLGTSSTAFSQALPPCPEDPNPMASVFWDNCFGTYTWADGNKYVGEYREDLKNGVGTMVSPNGTVIHGGLWLNGEPVVKR